MGTFNDKLDYLSRPDEHHDQGLSEAVPKTNDHPETESETREHQLILSSSESESTDSESESLGDWRLEDEPEHIQKAVKEMQANISAALTNATYSDASSSSDDE